MSIPIKRAVGTKPRFLDFFCWKERRVCILELWPSSPLGTLHLNSQLEVCVTSVCRLGRRSLTCWAVHESSSPSCRIRSVSRDLTQLRAQRGLPDPHSCSSKCLAFQDLPGKDPWPLFSANPKFVPVTIKGCEPSLVHTCLRSCTDVTGAPPIAPVETLAQSTSECWSL